MSLWNGPPRTTPISRAGWKSCCRAEPAGTAMIFKRARDPAYTDDDPRIVLVLRWATEPQPAPWIPFLISCGAFGIGMAILTVGAVDIAREGLNPPRRLTHLFVPAPRTVDQVRQPPVLRTQVSKAPGADTGSG